ncbi:MAG: hypothetical protein OXI34_16485 [Chloroflexota bacterium]|nr:hypothetical protein [Chloroflexota bacterium]MDE2946515.1 hypothetical protein [Chloroflexota bacterium]
MVVEMAVTGTVVRIEHQVNEFGWHQADMLLLCQLDEGGQELGESREAPEGMTLGVLGARVKVIDDWGLPGLREVKLGDLVYASGAWHAPGSHDLERDLRFLEAARDWYRTESWDAGDVGRLEVRAVEITGYDVRRFIVREARWEHLTETWCSWEDPTFDDAGWNVHRTVVGGYWNEHVDWDQKAVEALDRDVGIAWRAKNRQRNEELRSKQRNERQAKREAVANTATMPEVEAQKEAARQLAKRGQRRKSKKRKRG